MADPYGTNAIADPVNPAGFVLTNDFALNTYYTNDVQSAFVIASLTLGNAAGTDFSKVALYMDQNADGTWERTGLNAAVTGISTNTVELSAWIQPGGRFLFTNLSTGSGSAAVVANSSQWIKQ